MKIAILGYGKMGKVIERIALERGHEIGLKITSSNLEELTKENIENQDVAIDFSVPSNAVDNIKLCLNSHLPIVVGTTGWYDDFEAIKTECKEKNGALLTATNFSVGVNLFFELNRKLAQLMNSRKEYSAKIDEIHHTEKLDSPSGTAISLADDLINQHDNYTNWENQKTADNSTSLSIISEREPDVKGTHIISYESEVDKISIEHFAKNRDGFGLGAVLAAEFIHQKTGIFNMQDVLNL